MDSTTGRMHPSPRRQDRTGSQGKPVEPGPGQALGLSDRRDLVQVFDEGGAAQAAHSAANPRRCGQEHRRHEVQCRGHDRCPQSSPRHHQVLCGHRPMQPRKLPPLQRWAMPPGSPAAGLVFSMELKRAERCTRHGVEGARNRNATSQRGGAPLNAEMGSQRNIHFLPRRTEHCHHHTRHLTPHLSTP